MSRLRELVVVGFLDPPEMFDATVTNIPSKLSSPLQIVAALRKTACRMKIHNGMGEEFVGFYKGAVGSEVLFASTGLNGVSEVDVHLPRGTRVSIRSMGDLVDDGSLIVEFLGES